MSKYLLPIDIWNVAVDILLIIHWEFTLDLNWIKSHPKAQLWLFKKKKKTSGRIDIMKQKMHRKF